MSRFLLAAAVLLPSIAVAQEVDLVEETVEIRYKERTEINFDDLDVNAGIVKPEGQLITEPIQLQFNPLIRIRSSFQSEMKQSVDSVK